MHLSIEIKQRRSDGNKSFDTNGGIEGVHICYNFNPEEISEEKEYKKNFKNLLQRKHIRSVKTSGTTFKDDNQIVAYEDKKVNP
jgi:hypothetical protein